MLEVMAQAGSERVILYNELRYKVFALERQRGSEIAPQHFIRSFQRTILRFGAPMRHFTLHAEEGLTAGVAARHGIWQLIERGYLSSLPTLEECSVVVGLSSVSILSTLVGGTRALLHEGITAGIRLVSPDHRIRSEGIRQVSTVPWALYEVGGNARLRPISADKPVRELGNLPNVAVWADGKEQGLKRSETDALRWVGDSPVRRS